MFRFLLIFPIVGVTLLGLPFSASAKPVLTVGDVLWQLHETDAVCDGERARRTTSCREWWSSKPIKEIKAVLESKYLEEGGNDKWKQQPANNFMRQVNLEAKRMTDAAVAESYDR